jgi:hypothetical protein
MKLQELCGQCANRAFYPLQVRLACGSMVLVFFFFTNMLHIVQHVREKDLESSALPEANRAGCPDRRLVWNRRRNSCEISEPATYPPFGMEETAQR